MPTPVIEPTRIQRAVEPGATVTQDFLVNLFPEGQLVASIVSDSPFITLRNLVAYESERHFFTEEEIMELPPFPPSIRQKARQNGYLTYNELDRVGTGQPLKVSRELLVKGEVELSVPDDEPPGFDSGRLVLRGEGGWQDEIPVLLTIGKLTLSYPTPVYGHQGQRVRLPVTVTLPPDSAAVTLTLSASGPKWEIPMQSVSVPAGGSATTELKLVTSSQAPLGPVSDRITVKGFDGLRSGVPSRTCGFR